MKLISNVTIAALSLSVLCLSSCKQSEPDPYTGLKLAASSTLVDAGNSLTLTGTFYKEDAADAVSSVSYVLSSDTTGGAYFGTAGTTTTSVTSGSAVALTLGSVTSGQVKVSATCGSYSSVLCCGVKGNSSSISASDLPSGFASYGASSQFGGNGGTVVTVTARSDLLTYAKKGNYVIYVDGMIDMTGGCLPSSATDDDAELGAFISNYTGGTYTSWSAWRKAYAGACTSSSDYTSTDSTLNGYQTKLVNAWKALIQISVAKNTTIIGLTSSCGIKGGTISLSGVSNVALRNLVIQDPIDPFPHHEDGDGFNAQYDGITIQGTTSHIWIDHCTFEDTICTQFSDFAYPSLSGGGSEMWQIYDGLCDMKDSADYVTVSYCIFKNHDKTMLFGSSDSNCSNNNNGLRTITLHHNEFINCVQRLPMVRNTMCHIYNNYYYVDGSGYSNSYAVGLRAGNEVYAEGNYFGSGITATSDSYGNYYFINNSGCSSMGSAAWQPSSWYAYSADSPGIAKSDVSTTAGAGILSVNK
jgi:pectate lyase